MKIKFHKNFSLSKFDGISSCMKICMYPVVSLGTSGYYRVFTCTKEYFCKPCVSQEQSVGSRRSWEEEYTLKQTYSALVPAFDPRPGRTNVPQIQDFEVPPPGGCRSKVKVMSCDVSCDRCRGAMVMYMGTEVMG